ncbi:hypothetical protein C2G38_2193733 [Gigaspora rosea]|uniref:Uncharacterized protein n=1 Tax=Gigaspora rosea TaxID=44941 RepID=A0A397V1N2_9GLOM|nr:hypothetical protein C2G38_2193733 [Gigaspora rosea]
MVTLALGFANYSIQNDIRIRSIKPLVSIIPFNPSHIVFLVSKQKEKASDCGCIFASLVSTYKAIGLSPCGEGKWRNTNGPLAAKRIGLFYGPTQENQIPNLDDTNEDDLSINITDPIVKLDRIKQFLDIVQLENRQKSELIMELNGRIEEMQEFIYDQEIEIEELRDLCDEKIKHNEMLVEQWNSRFSDRQK